MNGHSPSGVKNGPFLEELMLHIYICIPIQFLYILHKREGLISFIFKRIIVMILYLIFYCGKNRASELLFIHIRLCFMEEGCALLAV
ncbi:hypothetical protein KTT_13750 [Tengunoibacter tsumagoiensis]|uniref:Uncharacterized protein n=1 Tax=Tengunoibacter tsumagoiensis TaxID=2014871 RepID=A0A401ZXD8_9CHLR|nr:hypothetical protein KTT_13750 [Tengunoibacter tsumagoiensis]